MAYVMLGGVITMASLRLWWAGRGNVMAAVFLPRVQILHALSASALLWGAVPSLLPLAGWLALVAVAAGRRLSAHTDTRELAAAGVAAVATAAVYTMGFASADAHAALSVLLLSALAAVPLVAAAAAAAGATSFYCDFAQDVRARWVWALLSLLNTVVAMWVPWDAASARWGVLVVVAAWHAPSTLLPAWRLVHRDPLFNSTIVENDNQRRNYGGDRDAAEGDGLDAFDAGFFASPTVGGATEWYFRCYVPYICSGQWRAPMVFLGDYARSIDGAADLVADTAVYFRQVCSNYNRERHNVTDVVVPFPAEAPGARPETVAGELKAAAELEFYVRTHEYERMMYVATAMGMRLLTDDNQRAVAFANVAVRFTSQSTIVPGESGPNPHCIQRGALGDFARNLTDAIMAMATVSVGEAYENASADRPINNRYKPAEFSLVVREMIATYMDLNPGIQRHTSDTPAFRTFFHREFLPRIVSLYAERRRRWAATLVVPHTHRVWTFLKEHW